MSISTLTDPSHSSIPATICLEREGETLSPNLFRIEIVFFSSDFIVLEVKWRGKLYCGILIKSTEHPK